jgi:hypothetical protein
VPDTGATGLSANALLTLQSPMNEKGIAVYSGPGSSHSWTWLADLFESHGVFNVRFVGPAELRQGVESSVRAVIVSGGDGFAIAEELSGRGFDQLKEFINGGGLYAGICAGAYLPLPSSIKPFNQFNMSDTRIANIARASDVDSLTSPRVSIRYGACRIYHPVRGEVALRIGQEEIRAPLYGGPVFAEPAKDDVIMRYHGFSSTTEYQIGPSEAESMMLGKPAAVLAEKNGGRLVLLGPHLEHPRYPEANALFLKLLGVQGLPGEATQESSAIGRQDSHVRKAIADLKVAVLGLEKRSFLVGNKLWDAGRFLELIAAIEKRVATLDESIAVEVSGMLLGVREEILRSDSGTMENSDSGPGLLVEAARRCVDHHFSVLRGSR